MQQQINLGTPPSGVGGDSYRTSFTKINENFTEVYTALGTSALSGQLVLTREHMSNATNLVSSTTVASSTAVKAAYDFAATKLTATSNAVSASKLATIRTLSYTGDATGSMSFDGSANASAALALANSGVTAGTYKSVTVDAKGRVTAATDIVTGLVTSTSSAGTTNVVTTNTNTFFNVTENIGGTLSSTGLSAQVTGAGTVTVTSDTTGKVTITGAQTITGNAATATKLATARTLALSGDVTGSATFDGSANSTITTTVADNSHNHTIANITNLQTTLDSMSITQTATLPATAGWYRIATSPVEIARVSGRFEVDWTLSGNHGQVIFNAAIMYGTGIALNQSLYSTFAVNGLSKARIVYHTTYTGNYAYLEVYNSTAAAISLTVTGLGLMGWSLVAPSTVGSIPAGYTSRELTFVDGMSTEGQYVSTVATGVAPLSVLSTTKVTNLNADLLDGYNTATTATASTIPVRDASGNLAGNVLGSAATLTTARTISLTGDVTGSVSFNGSANASITSTIPSKGLANGIATLDATGKIPSAQLPSYVDDVLEFTNLAAFPVTGESSKIYIDLTTGLTYRWADSTYVGVGGGSGTADSALRLFNTRSISASGDATWSVSFDGSANATAALTLANSGVTAGSYAKVTVDAKGRVTAGTTMVAADVPSLDTSKLTTGTLGVARGGTGLASFTQWGVPYASTTTAMAYTAAGTAGQVLKSNGAAAPTWVTLDLTYLPDAVVKKSVRVATTANITLSAPQTIDGIAVVANDRILVKNQTTTSANGIYIVQAAAWIRAPDADTSAKIAGAVVNVDSGTANGGLRFDTDFKTTDTLGTTAMTWQRSVDTGMASTVVGTTPGTAAIGTSLNYARADHVHPVQTTVSGNAGTATKLATARTINGTPFDGTANITFNNLEPVAITSGQDFNSFTTPGMYYCPANSTAATLVNRPTASAFSMLVEKHAGVKQTVTEYMITNAKTYSRNFYSTWGPWYRVYTTIDEPGQFIGTQSTKAIYYNAQTITEDVTIPGSLNAMSAGPLTINTGFTVTISDGATWTIV